jgi:16S rRNA (cytosine967-C5)-methyltransferase
MLISPARVTAFEILLRVDQQASYASELLHSSSYQTLAAPHHRLATELVMGVLRWRSVLDEQIAKYSSVRLAKIDPEVLIALRLAGYQLMFLDRIPAHAAIHESVELVKRARKRSAVPFTNAVLRKFADSSANSSAPGICWSPAELASVLAHPQWLVDRWILELGIDTTRKICQFDQRIPETTITTPDSVSAQELEKYKIKLAPGRLLESSRRLIDGDLARLPASVRNRVAIQDEGSNLVAHLVGRGSRILDCCAAPGGKTRILTNCNSSAFIVAADLHFHRARSLRKLLGAENVHVIVADARAIPLQMGFERVLVDVPCSGTGTLARNPEIKWRLTPEDLSDLQARQVAILHSAIQQVVPGGKLIYATCSLEKEENEDVVEKALAANSSVRLLDCHERLQQLRDEGKLIWEDIDSLTRGPYLRTIPGIHPCDGFFAAILGKR